MFVARRAGRGYIGVGDGLDGAATSKFQGGYLIGCDVSRG